MTSVKGGFAAWSAWGRCFKQCGDGIQRRTRTCTNPKPAYGGANCVGIRTQSRTCKIKECPGKNLYFRY